MKGAVALQIELELGNRCKFSVAVFKSKNLVLKWCFRRDGLCPELVAFANF